MDSDIDRIDYSFTNDTNVSFDYTYDRSGRLTGQSVNQASWEWSPATSSVAFGNETYARNNLDQYTSVSGQALSYDANGNLTSDGARSFTYTAENQLSTFTGTGVVARYGYGPAARRVRKETGPNTSSITRTDFLHAGEMEIAEYDNAGNLLRRYIPGASVDQRILMVDCGTSAGCVPNEAGTNTLYYFSDRLGNVLAVTDNTGAIQQRFFYTPFGVEMVGNATGNPFRYTGRRYDAETGLYYYRARYYDADLGRFLQVDPIGYADQWNLYAYVGNNPLNATDPSGMCSTGTRIKGRSAAGCNIAYQAPNRGARGAASPASQPASQPSPQPSSQPQQPANDNNSAANDNNRQSSGQNRGRGGLERLLRRLFLAGEAVNSSFEQGQRLRLREEYEENPEQFVLVVRYWGGDARRMGRSWAPLEAAAHSDPRSHWGIPDVNTMEMISYGAMRKSSIETGDILVRAALPLDGYPGGGTEYRITVPEAEISTQVLIYLDRVNRGGY